MPGFTLDSALHDCDGPDQFEIVGGDYSHTGAELFRWAPVTLLILLVLKFLLRRAPAYIQFAVFFAFLTALPPLAVTWANVAIIPQPERYHLEMELALALLAGLLLDAGLRRLPATGPRCLPLWP